MHSQMCVNLYWPYRFDCDNEVVGHFDLRYAAFPSSFATQYCTLGQAGV